ncbi:PTS sugar transporter subunit IIA [Metabacillus malikii]|uniref:Glucose-specific phosphotransferase system IIA component n=1 Tax=Metabacillus malikii TaxID=1504265 RepID=A0ABT9ZJT5_9BACI|nr:PTS glucose transporter subunit IIA [Metabacillus malikii]MDQ0232557.1 glucose-specific phosphotransferase system IIA component [Metabacillus malikii]
MLGSLFNKKKEIILVAPLTGKVVLLEDVPDQVFSQKMMGDGVAIIPTDNELVAPFDGEVVDVFPTKHAITLRSKEGLEILIHMGLDTVNLNGEGFTVHVNGGDKIKSGQSLANYDIQHVANAGLNVITPIIIMNQDRFEISDRKNDVNIINGKDVILEVKKR